MVSILNRGGLSLALIALITLIVVSSSFQTISVADARRPYNRVRQLAEDCNSPRQGEVPGCGGGGGSGGSSRPSTPSGSSSGSSHCENSCCRKDKFGECVCC